MKEIIQNSSENQQKKFYFRNKISKFSFAQIIAWHESRYFRLSFILISPNRYLFKFNNIKIVTNQNIEQEWDNVLFWAVFRSA